MPFLQENWLILLPAWLAFMSIYLLLPSGRRILPIWVGLALGAAALVLGAVVLIRADTVSVETILFYLFAGVSIAGGGMMITQRNPVHAALSFAIVVLSTCGLFLLQAAPFLMAATMIIYAGAIVVTFLFVIMLAQQEGVSSADQFSREPFLAALAGCVLMASLLCVIHKTYNVNRFDEVALELQKISDAKDEAELKALLGDPEAKSNTGKLTRPIVEKLRDLFPPPAKEETDRDRSQMIDNIEHLQQAWNHMKGDQIKMRVDQLKKKAKTLLETVKARQAEHASLALHNVPGKPQMKTPSHFVPGKLPAANVAGIGRTLFTDYLVPVELAATLLLIATIGAIVIAGRRSEELR